MATSCHTHLPSATYHLRPEPEHLIPTLSPASERIRQCYRTEAVLRRLSHEFPAAENLGEGELEAAIDDRGAEGEVADEMLLVDAVTVGEGIAVEKNITGDGAPVGESK